MIEAVAMRERLFTMRLSDEEIARLEAVSKHYGLNAAGTIRMLVKKEHDEIARDNKRRDDNRWFSFLDEVEKAVKATGVRGLHLVPNLENESIEIHDGSRGKTVDVADFYGTLVSWPGSKLANYEWDFERREYVKLKKPRKR